LEIRKKRVLREIRVGCKSREKKKAERDGFSGRGRTSNDEKIAKSNVDGGEKKNGKRSAKKRSFKRQRGTLSSSWGEGDGFLKNAVEGGKRAEREDRRHVTPGSGKDHPIKSCLFWGWRKGENSDAEQGLRKGHRKKEGVPIPEQKRERETVDHPPNAYATTREKGKTDSRQSLRKRPCSKRGVSVPFR